MVKHRTHSRILIVEDEPDIGDFLEYTLKLEGYRAVLARSGQEAIEQLRHEPADLILLDLMLPDMSGLEVLKSVRRSEETGDPRVIILTARKDEVDRILGFELGADDYVTKPFSPRELVLRVRAVLHRGEQPPPPADSRKLNAGPIEVDIDLHEARVQGKPLKLTLTEFRLLAELVKNVGRVRTRQRLLSEVWGYDSDVMSRTVDTHVRRLRNKLGPAAPWLSTTRGVGYRIQDPELER